MDFLGSGEEDGAPSWKITSQLCYPSTPSSPLRDGDIYEKENDGLHQPADELANVAGLRTSGALAHGSKIQLSVLGHEPELTTADSKLHVSASVCSKCGALIKPDYSFCNSCGHAVSYVAPATPAADRAKAKASSSLATNDDINRQEPQAETKASASLVTNADMNGHEHHRHHHRIHSSGGHQTHANTHTSNGLHMSPLFQTGDMQKSAALHTIAGEICFCFVCNPRIAGTLHASSVLH